MIERPPLNQIDENIPCASMGQAREEAARLLAEAVRSGDAKRVAAQLRDTSASAAVDLQGKYRRYGVVHEAVISPNATEIIPMLAGAGFDTNAYDSRAQTPLQWAVEACADDAVVKTLIDCGANVHCRDNDEKTLLLPAAQLGRLDLCRLLIAAGIDVNASEKGEWTALHMALMNERIEVCRLLVEAGASTSWTPDLPSDSYLTPFQTAVRFGAVKSIVFCVAECGESLEQVTLAGQTIAQLAGSSRSATAAFSAALIEAAASAQGGAAISDSSAPARARTLKTNEPF